MKFTTSQHGTVTVIALQGNLMGGPDATALNAALHGLVDGGTRHVVLDLAGVEFMNSSGLSLLIGGATILKNAGGGLKLARASAKIGSLIKITKLGGVFENFLSVEAAIGSFGK
jgi:anti-sigma B factor antagonist